MVSRSSIAVFIANRKIFADHVIVTSISRTSVCAFPIPSPSSIIYGGTKEVLFLYASLIRSKNLDFMSSKSGGSFLAAYVPLRRTYPSLPRKDWIHAQSMLMSLPCSHRLVGLRCSTMPFVAATTTEQLAMPPASCSLCMSCFTKPSYSPSFRGLPLGP